MLSLFEGRGLICVGQVLFAEEMGDAVSFEYITTRASIVGQDLIETKQRAVTFSLAILLWGDGEGGGLLSDLGEILGGEGE